MSVTNGRPAAEQGILALAIQTPELTAQVLEQVRPEWITGPTERRLFSAVERLHHRGAAVDAATLYDELGGQVPVVDVARLCDWSGRTDVLPTYVGTLRDAHQRREIANIGRTALESDKPASAILHEMQAMLSSLDSGEVDEGLPRLCRLLSGEEVEIGWLVEDLMQEAEFGVLLGTGEAAKSTFILHAGLAVALGKPVLGRFNVRQGPVVLISGEDGLPRIQMRARALCRGHGWSWADADDHIVGLARAGVLLENEAWTTHLLREIRAIQPAMIVFDPLRDLTLAPENDNAALAPAIRFLRELTELDSAPTIPVVHHTGYATAVPRSGADQGRGWSSLPRAARYVLNLQAEPKREGQPLRVHVGISKNNDLGYREPFGFELSVSTGPDSHVWKTARLTYRRQDELRKSTAHAAMLEVIREQPGMTTNEMQGKAGKRVKIDPRDLKRIRDDLEAEGLIRFEHGSNRSKLWYPTETAK